MVYITGCFDRTSSFTMSENECNNAGDHDEEVRGVILRSFMPEADAGELGPVTLGSSNINVPYTLQTVE
jgi:hypothetical protein